jgi:hypothetical protein
MSASGFSSGGVGAAAAAAAVFRAPASFSRGSIVGAAAYVFCRLLFFSGRISVNSAVRRLSSPTVTGAAAPAGGGDARATRAACTSRPCPRHAFALQPGGAALGSAVVACVAGG